MKYTKTMGSICSNEAKDIKPPSDLSELLQQTEKVALVPVPFQICQIISLIFSVRPPNPMAIGISEILLRS